MRMHALLSIYLPTCMREYITSLHIKVIKEFLQGDYKFFNPVYLIYDEYSEIITLNLITLRLH